MSSLGCCVFFFFSYPCSFQCVRPFKRSPSPQDWNWDPMGRWVCTVGSNTIYIYREECFLAGADIIYKVQQQQQQQPSRVGWLATGTSHL